MLLYIRCLLHQTNTLSSKNPRGCC